MSILSRLAKLAASVALISASAACVTDGDEGGRPDEVQEDWRSGGKGDGETCDFESMSAATYYKQFAYEAIVDEESSRTWYRVGLTWDVQAVLDNGDRVDLDVYFLENDRVIVEYSELRREGSSYVNNNETVIVTRASYDETTRAITLAGVGSGTPITITNGRGGCRPGIDFTFSADIRSPGIAGDGTQISTGLTSAFVIDPDHLDQVPNETARRWFEEDVATGKIKVIRF
jgi:hypothetical protein